MRPQSNKSSEGHRTPGTVLERAALRQQLDETPLLRGLGRGGGGEDAPAAMTLADVGIPAQSGLGRLVTPIHVVMEKGRRSGPRQHGTIITMMADLVVIWTCRFHWQPVPGDPASRP